MSKMAAASHPVFAEFSSQNFVSASGVAIFHLKSERVVLCYHTRDKYWFLPKGRRDAGESHKRAAEREGFEESGYRNRLLPLPIPHRQPSPHSTAALSDNVIEPIWISLLPNSRRTQYLLNWYIAETLPPALEASLSAPQSREYIEPPAFPGDLTLKARMEMEEEGYEPVRYEGTGVDEEEALYESELVGVREAVVRLGSGAMSEVVRLGWEAVRQRMEAEKAE